MTYINSDSLVSTQWLADHLSTQDVLIVDAGWFLPGEERNGREEYKNDHITGAVFFDIDGFSDSQSDLPHMLPGPDTFSSMIAHMGISDGHRIVVYDRHGLFSAARVWWTLRAFGHDEVAILDGGFPKWQREEATNHVVDCGVNSPCGNRALLSTINYLKDAEIKIAGAGSSLAEAFDPIIFNIDGITFGILAFDDVAAQNFAATDDKPGTAPLDDDYSDEIASGYQSYFHPASALSLNRFKKLITDLVKAVDVVIVQVQTGTEDTHDPSERSIKALRAARSAGATLVIGNQAHHVQAIEPLEEGKFIAYALGNFIFDQIHTPEHMQGFLLEATFWGKNLVNLRFLPYEIKDRYRPVFVHGSLRLKILEDVFEATKRLVSQD